MRRTIKIPETVVEEEEEVMKLCCKQTCRRLACSEMIFKTLCYLTLTCYLSYDKGGQDFMSVKIKNPKKYHKGKAYFDH